jgi:phosphatidylinositol alpha-mannosyltransferase
MKIALVTPYDYPYPGGVTEHIRHLDREFRARGHDTRIIAPSSESQDALESNVIKISGDVLPIPFNGSTARITLSPEVSRRVEEILNDEQFDIVHLHEPEAPLLGWAVLHASRAINVGTFHAYSETNVLNEYAQPFMEWIHTQLDGRIFVSPALRDSITPYFPGEHRVIPNGIDYARFAGSEPSTSSRQGLQPVAGFDDGRPNILFVGRLDARKGFRHLLHAYPHIKHTIPDARLLVVGAFGKEDKTRFAEYVRASDLHDVHFIGRVSREELPHYYRTATIFCAPSTGGESFGIVLLEAMAAGLPIVASDIAGYRSVVQDGVEGCLVPPGEENALAGCIIALLGDSERRERMAAQGRATATRYDWQIVAPRVLDYYQELIQACVLRRTGRQYALASRDPKLAQKVDGVNAVLNSLMHGLSLLETEPVPHNGTPGAAYRLGEGRFAIASPPLPGMKVSAQMNNLFKFELVVKS